MARGGYREAALTSGACRRRDHSESELRRALARQGHEDDGDRGGARHGFARERLPRRRAASPSASRGAGMAGRGLGRHRIRQGPAAARGVARTTTEAALRDARREVSEGEVLDAVARRYWARNATDEPARRLRKLWAFLLRRGFPATLVARAPAGAVAALDRTPSRAWSPRDGSSETPEERAPRRAS